MNSVTLKGGCAGQTGVPHLVAPNAPRASTDQLLRLHGHSGVHIVLSIRSKVSSGQSWKRWPTVFEDFWLLEFVLCSLWSLKGFPS